jgi:hypothetical protein
VVVDYATPRLQPDDYTVLEIIAEQRERLRLFTQHNPRRWTGSLRRNSFAMAVQGSSTIEGYTANLDRCGRGGRRDYRPRQQPDQAGGGCPPERGPARPPTMSV